MTVLETAPAREYAHLVRATKPADAHLKELLEMRADEVEHLRDIESAIDG